MANIRESEGVYPRNAIHRTDSVTVDHTLLCRKAGCRVCPKSSGRSTQNEILCDSETNNVITGNIIKCKNVMSLPVSLDNNDSHIEPINNIHRKLSKSRKYSLYRNRLIESQKVLVRENRHWMINIFGLQVIICKFIFYIVKGVVSWEKVYPLLLSWLFLLTPVLSASQLQQHSSQGSSENHFLETEREYTIKYYYFSVLKK